MPRTFQKKTRRYRGKRTFGTGKIGTRRSKGQHGGHGLTAGKFKYHWSKYLKMKKLGFPGEEGKKWMIGKNGFTPSPTAQRLNAVNAINIKEVESKLDVWEKENKISKDGKTYVVNLTELGYDKLIGKGEVTQKMVITVDSASKGVVEKMKAAKCELKLAASD